MNLSKDANESMLSDSPALPQLCDAIIITMIIVIEAAQLLVF